MTYILNSYYYPNTTFFFPDKECPNGCAAHIVRIDDRGVLVKELSFLSHMVEQPSPITASIFLTSDGNHLVLTTRIERSAGVYLSDIREVLPGTLLAPETTELHYFSTRYRSCLLSGNFLETSPNPTPNRQK